MPRIISFAWVLLLFAGCGGGAPGTGSTAAKPTVTSLSISGPTVFHALGEGEVFTATATLSNGSTRDETAIAGWRSSLPSVLTVEAGGNAKAVAAGTADVIATSGGASASMSVRVVPPNWSALSPLPPLNPGGPSDASPLRIAVDPRDENVLYVGSRLGLYVSRDRGVSWIRQMLGQIDALALDPHNPDRVYALVSEHSLVRTTDAGKTFATVTSSDDILESLLVSSLEDRTVYVGYGGIGDPNPSGTLKSDDDGAHWTRQSFGASGALIPWTVAQDGVTGTLYAGTEIADHPQPYHPPFFTSPDRGKTWFDATNGLTWHVTDMFVNRDDHSVLALEEGPGLFKSTDGARSWTLFCNVSGTSLGVDPRDPTRMFVGAVISGNRTGGAFASYNAGKTFFASGLDNMTVAGFAYNGTSTRVYAACYGSGVYFTDIEPPTGR